MKSKNVKIGSVILIAAGFLYLLFEAIAALAWQNPGYSYTYNYISDLGIPIVTEYMGHYINSPRYYFMNMAFISNGILFATGIFLITASLQKKKIALNILAAIYGLGVCVVGLFPGYDWWGGVYHGFGALAAIGIGNIAIMCIGIASGTKTQNTVLSIVSVAFCVIGISAFVIFMGSEGSPIIGLWERIAVYTVIIWQPIFGGVLLSEFHNSPETGK